MRIRLFLLSALMVLTLSACGGNVREMTFTDANHEEVIGEVLQSGDLTDEEKTQFSLVVGKAQATNQSLTGKSVADVLAEAKAGGQ